MVLTTENPDLSDKYRETSIAEQNSIDLAWDMFMRNEYRTLRLTLCPTEADLKRFRQLVVQMVMSTDIMDKDIGKLRKERWDKAFAEQTSTAAENRNRKATIVIEHLIQASDVSHTMQHWHIYRKWNQNLFFELYHAYKQGRLENDPSTNWYKGELGFFDFYVIPLAKKLDTCGVFGVTSDEFMIYASANRKVCSSGARFACFVASRIVQYPFLSVSNRDIVDYLGVGAERCPACRRLPFTVQQRRRNGTCRSTLQKSI